MSLWHRLLRRFGSPQPTPTSAATPPLANERLVTLPNEPYVFECRDCGKVFDARRRRPLCPECDSRNVELVSE